MKYIPCDLKNEIRGKYGFLSGATSAEIKLRADRVERKALEGMAHVNSFRIEHPELRVPFSVPKNNKRRIKMKGIPKGKARRITRKGIENLRLAFEWGRQNFDPEDFQESLIRGIAGRVLPEMYGGRMATYRVGMKGTNITGSRTTPPYPAKLTDKEIPNFVEGMRRQLGSEDVIRRMETAIYAHFHIARMHPFVDGNGRTARILQDVILDYFDLPPPIVEVGERNTYNNLLEGAIFDWKAEKNWEKINGATRGEQLFYTFMAEKVIVSMDKLIGE